MVKECAEWARQTYGYNTLMETLKMVTGATSGQQMHLCQKYSEDNERLSSQLRKRKDKQE